MKIAVLSGKGGTGKTLVSVNLAAVANQSVYMDCDVEEPNGHLFFKPENVVEEEVTVAIPTVDNALCTGCRKCVDFCKFNALAYIKDQLLIFDEVCHSCGGCMMFCPEHALTEKPKVIGKVQTGTWKQTRVSTGVLEPGEASGTPIIKRLMALNEGVTVPTIIDCPPGSACIVMDSIKEADYCILVAEPTIFGVHNLQMVHELVQLFNKPYGVVLNKCLVGEENPAEMYALEHNINILARIPYDNVLGKLNSNAKIAVVESKRYRDLFTELLFKVEEEVQHETTPNS